MSSLTKGLILLGVIIVGLVFWKSRVGHAAPEYNVLTKEEIAILVSDIATQNPKAVRRLKEDPELRKQQLENIKQLLAFASQAQREGLANESPYREELGYIRQQIIAALYDREINKDKGPVWLYRRKSGQGILGRERLGTEEFFREPKAKTPYRFSRPRTRI